MTATEPIRTEQPFRILVADDDRGNREAIGDFLTAKGFVTVLAADGGEAVEIAQGTTVHLAFLDMHMPRLTGLETLLLVRQIHEWLPAILMTADATRDVMRLALQERVHTVLPKPVSPNLALHAIAQALNKAYGNASSPGLMPKPGMTTQINIHARITINRTLGPPTPPETDS
jgi:two-component system, response regulator PdtaR